ncbi:hypothetical protein E4U32_003760 [Claviceps aff. humidiphila group G2b]|nr:hypothetical protein E4U32_003760 [Claviceps aff. humidiphila group G2b]
MSSSDCVLISTCPEWPRRIDGKTEMGSAGRMLHFSGEDTGVYRYRDGGATEFGERRGNPDFSGAQCSDTWYLGPPHSTGPANSTFCSLPPCSSILEGPCPPAPIPSAINLTDGGTSPSRRFSSLQPEPCPPATIPRGARPAATGSSVGEEYQEVLTRKGPVFVKRDDYPGSKEAQAKRNSNARSSELSRVKRQEKQAREKAKKMEDKYKEAKADKQAAEEKLRLADEARRQEREASQRIIRQEREASQRIIRQQAEENRYLRQQLENKK